ncbi:PaaI family thioesterase [Billgrantia ethanolica]|uniref:PaaI family thioesterase n=1 Tax=Billgrantia ethanolica TaxID=2733486 RepID=A0ABS8ZZF1_9GAMM|nr:PaaI family thioesterase [Halomonas ethanolica]MCE8001967.1 PaaI family thioesterase [Halomonas ethanolica]
MNEAEQAPLMGYHELLGMRVVEWSGGVAVVELVADKRHLNRSGIVHGGVLTSMLDSALSLAGLYCDVPGHVRRGMTLSLTTTFIAPAGAGVLRATGRVRGGGSKVYLANGEVHDATGELLAIAEGAFRRRSGSESPQGLPE